MILNSVNQIQSTDRLFVSPADVFTLRQPLLSDLRLHGLHHKLNTVSQRNQWIMFTAQCPRQNIISLSTDQTWSDKVIHIMPSRRLSEFDVVEKAIRSGNASAIVASNQITHHQQSRLTALAEVNQCQLFFVDTSEVLFH